MLGAHFPLDRDTIRPVRCVTALLTLLSQALGEADITLLGEGHVRGCRAGAVARPAI